MKDTDTRVFQARRARQGKEDVPLLHSWSVLRGQWRTVGGAAEAAAEAEAAVVRVHVGRSTRGA